MASPPALRPAGRVLRGVDAGMARAPARRASRGGRVGARSTVCKLRGAGRDARCRCRRSEGGASNWRRVARRIRWGIVIQLPLVRLDVCRLRGRLRV